MTYRSRKLLDLAHSMHDCTLQIPGVCSGYSAEGCEPAHGPKSMLNGGMGCKSADVFAAACHSCHAEIDQGKALSKDDRQWYWLRGAARTWAKLMEAGRIVVAPEPRTGNQFYQKPEVFGTVREG